MSLCVSCCPGNGPGTPGGSCDTSNGSQGEEEEEEEKEKWGGGGCNEACKE